MSSELMSSQLRVKNFDKIARILQKQGVTFFDEIRHTKYYLTPEGDIVFLHLDYLNTSVVALAGCTSGAEKYLESLKRKPR